MDIAGKNDSGMIVVRDEEQRRELGKILNGLALGADYEEVVLKLSGSLEPDEVGITEPKGLASVTKALATPYVRYRIERVHRSLINVRDKNVTLRFNPARELVEVESDIQEVANRGT